jgi:uncharacterized protein YhfF
MHSSLEGMWTAYHAKCARSAVSSLPPAWHFCDNQADADVCAALVLAGRKRATTPSLWFFESRGLAVPAVGDLDIVTNWDGIAQCIIQTTVVHITPFST